MFIARMTITIMEQSLRGPVGKRFKLIYPASLYGVNSRSPAHNPCKDDATWQIFTDVMPLRGRRFDI